MNNIITVIEIIKLRRFKSNNIQCWQLPGPVSLANSLFPGTIYFFILYTPDPTALSKNSQSRQKPSDL